MKPGLSIAIALVFGAALSSVGYASGPIPPVLAKAMASAGKLRYAGTRTVTFRMMSDSNRHQEYVVRDGDRVRVEFPKESPFAGQVIVEDGKDRYHYFPDQDRILVLPPRRDEAKLRLTRMTQGPGSERFSFAAEGIETVAGVKTETVSIKDEHGNVSQRLYIEPKTGVIVKRTLYDPVGTVVGGYEFERIDLRPRIDRGTFRLVRKGAQVVRPEDEVLKLSSAEGYVDAILPRSTGFRLEFVQNIHGGRSPMMMQSYTSGESRVTLFQLKSDIDPNEVRRFGRGRVMTYAWKASGRQFVLVGSMPQSELARLAKALVERP